MAMAIAVPAALAAACCFALARAVLHSVAMGSGEGTLNPRLLAALARSPWWPAGQHWAACRS